mmetsp:Transcript_22796/g.38040  ORF Transcript_22796/g.38040 Transcript_22796/m.38040 type:complete len:546 (-) Transcript_22796:56-1693(-)|eukprot:CAMPEP_0174964304 /NCGR_PEP_ID=MMETSP0004_2-20121128/5804_1 /TAXON_ID=420556 /ORGANISM="Ochromonas sp., Strain CCMP1393" /LENGTH=545 /DNA_ID=CAMNT_0016213011 /DNA_START=1 /DNA_END=1638 /DNA_ORIENTATION=+
MNSYLEATLDDYRLDLQRKLEVYGVVRELVEDVVLWDSDNALRQTQSNLARSERLNYVMANKIRRLQSKNKVLNNELSTIREQASLVRDSFVRDIGRFLLDSKQSQKMKKKIANLEAQLEKFEEFESARQVDSMLSTGSIGHASPVNPDSNVSAIASTTESKVLVDANEPKSTNNSSSSEVAIKSVGINDALQDATTSHKQEFYLYDLEDDFLLQIFSYLDTMEVLHVAQVCKFVFKRVDDLFSIESNLIKPEWCVRPDQAMLLRQQQEQEQQQQQEAGKDSNPPCEATNSSSGSGVSGASISINGLMNRFITADSRVSSDADMSSASSTASTTAAATTAITATTASAASESPVLTKEIVDVLIKKLSAAELKVILSIAERSKKQIVTIESLNTEKEDLIARLENTESVRNFLIEKLKAAETEIKSLMGANSSLKRQSLSDQEIILFLDQKGDEMAAEKEELVRKCNQLQASLDLQVGTYSHKEQQLTVELNELKFNYEKLDANSKAQKKVLIREVKTLRAQVDKLTTERNVQENQFRMLKEALG